MKKTKPKQSPQWVDWALENTRKSREAIAAALLERMLSILDRNAHDLAPAVVDALRRWVEEDVNPEALVKWLMERGGWDKVKVNGDKVEAALIMAARAACPDKDDPTEDGVSAALWPRMDSPCYALLYDVPRADDHAPAVLVRIARNTEAILAIIPSMAPEDWPKPDWVTALLGLDALKIGLQNYDWSGLSLCLTDKAGKDGDWLRLLAGPWLEERLEYARRDTLAVGITIRPKARTEAGNEWTPLPRALDIAAGMGGPFSVDVDGEKYTPEPDLAGAAVGRALRLRGLDIVPAAWLGNDAQMNLALDLTAPPEAVREYMIETATRTAHLAQLPNMCPKLLGFMFAAAPMTGRPVKGTLLDLARWLYPDWGSRRQNKRDLQGLGAAFVAIKGLRLVETKPDGTRHPYDLFTVDYDLSCKPDAALGFMVNPWLVERMKGGKGGGFFLLNMTRWLALGIQNPRLFPLALRLAALWDAARNGGIYEPARLRPIEADRLAWECNTLPEGAAMYRAGKIATGTAKAALSAARANLEADLDDLREAGLLGQWTKRKVHGRGFELLPVPPADYAEACKRASQVIKHRPKGKP